jgi:hypothetical protein
MLLSPEDAAQFFKLMPALQVFANRKLQIIKGLENVAQYQKISNEQRAKLRNAFYQNTDLIDEFVRENPLGFWPEELAIISGWKNFVAGEFMIERVLKKYAIFIGNEKVYGVLALTEPFRQVIGGMPLPVYVKTVLLPFNGKIIYDGLIEGYNIFFGHGVATSASNTYKAAKQQGMIVESLDPDWKPPQPKVVISKNWKPVLREISEKTSKLRASGGDAAVLGPAFSLIRASLEFAQNATDSPDDLDVLDKSLQKVQRAFEKLQDTYYLSGFEFLKRK